MNVEHMGSDWGTVVVGGLSTATSIYSSYTQKEIAELQADTLKDIAKTQASISGGQPSPVVDNKTMYIILAGAGGLILLTTIMMLGRK